MKKITLSLLLALVAGLIEAQTTNLAWVNQLGAAGDDYGTSIAVDASGNVYAVGSFRSSVDFDPGPGNVILTSVGSDDFYITKSDAAGNLVWAGRMGGTSSERDINITLDASGNIYLTGDFAGTADFDPTILGTSNLTASAGLDIFVVRLDTDGNFVWARRMGGSGNDYGQSIVVDVSGNVHVSGTFNTTVDFDPGGGIFNLTSAGGFDVYVLKLNSSGIFVWAKRMGGTVLEQGNSIAVDVSGNVYTTGYFGGTADFDPGGSISNLISVGAEDIFISKLDISGNFVWALQMGGSLLDNGTGIVLDGVGNFYVTGYFRNTVDFDPGAGSFPLTSAGLSEIFVCKLDASGNFMWAKQIGGAADDISRSIAPDPSGNVYITGLFYGAADFDPGPGTFILTPTAAIDIFVSKLDASGNFVWAQQMSGGTGFSNYGIDIAVDNSGNVCTTGFFAGTVDFDPGLCTLNLSSAGLYDAFIHKMVITSVPPPAISYFSPVSGEVGATITINGTDFSAIPANNIVSFNGTTATVTASTATTITTTVPVDATTGPITVTVGCNTATSATNFVVGSCLPVAERNALIALFNSTNGASWTNKTNWLSADESTWFGVTVTGCAVTNIVLPNNNLVGPLPTEIGDLPNLIELNLSLDKVSGTLPSSITNLINLQILYVDNNNGITGPLPANIGNMTALQRINTQGNAFTGPIPPSMANCLALEDIQLEGNQHTGSVPAFFGLMTNLYSINLGFNLLTGSIPPELGNLPYLDYLSLADNDLTGTIPRELGNYFQLALLDLSRNRLSGPIPPELAHQIAMRSLQLWSNQLTGAIPTELGNLPNLQDLNLSENQLTGSIPIELGNLGALSFLQLHSNQLTGTIPTQLGNDILLKFIRLGTNQLTGSIPPELGNFPDVFLMDLDHNQLTGPIPPQLGNDTSLKYLNLNINQLSGPIPPVLGNLPLLEDLNIYSNQLTGSLPKELGQCVNLKRFGAGDNQLTGTLPKEYGSWTGLTDFGIYNNNITGAVPIEYLAWTNIIYLYLSGNKLDAIPTFTAGTIAEFNVDNNLFEFGDLEPNISVAGYNYSPQADLPGGSITINAGTALTIPFTTSGLANQYQWFKNSVLIPGATSATFSIVSTTISDAGNYTVNITSTIVTGLTLKSLPFVVTITPVINITLQPFDFTACDGTLATFATNATGTTNIAYQWQFSPDGIVPFTNIVNGGGYSNATTPVLSVNSTGNFGGGRYRCKISGDFAVTVFTFDEGLFITPVPSPPTTTGAGSCAIASVTLTASGGVNGQYRWYTVSTGGTAIAGQINSTYVTPVLSTTTNYYASISISSCESNRTLAIATVTIVSKPNVVTSNCTASAATLTGPAGFPSYAWSNGATAQQINVTVAGTYTLIVTTASGCSSPPSNPTTFSSTFCNQPPAITTQPVNAVVGGSVTLNLTSMISDPDNNLDLTTLQITTQPISGAVASIDASFNLLVNYFGVAFSGNDQLTIRVCDFSGACTTKDIVIVIAGEITVFNALSPNGDSKNEIFYIQYIDLIPGTKHNKVTIFNRWGDAVFETQDYDNVNRVFRGLNKSGNELPSGTYYYKLEFEGGAKARTGFISLRR